MWPGMCFTESNWPNLRGLEIGRVIGALEGRCTHRFTYPTTQKAHPLSLQITDFRYHTLLASQFGSVPIFVYPGTCGPTHGSGHVYLGLYPAGRPSRHGSDTFISQPLKTVSAVMLRAGMLFRSRVR